MIRRKTSGRNQPMVRAAAPPELQPMTAWPHGFFRAVLLRRFGRNGSRRPRHPALVPFLQEKRGLAPAEIRIVPDDARIGVVPKDVLHANSIRGGGEGRMAHREGLKPAASVASIKTTGAEPSPSLANAKTTAVEPSPSLKSPKRRSRSRPPL